MVDDEVTEMGCWALIPCRPSRLGYRTLSSDDHADSLPPGTVTVVVGKEKKVFNIDPFILQNNSVVRVLLETLSSSSTASSNSSSERRSRRKKAENSVVYVDVDAILFEHLLWLIHDNSSASLFEFEVNLKEIIEFYSQDC